MSCFAYPYYNIKDGTKDFLVEFFPFRYQIPVFPNIKRLFYAVVAGDISIAVGMRLNNYIVFYFNSRYILAIVYHAVNVISKKLPVGKTIF